jgi:hypothetical protein
MTLDELITGLEQRGFIGCSEINSRGRTRLEDHYVLFTDGLVIYSDRPHWDQAPHSATWPIAEFQWTDLDKIIGPRCRWETVMPDRICGRPAAYRLKDGKLLCEYHGSHIKHRWPETPMTAVD